MCWLWAGGSLLECNLKNYNLPKILYVVSKKEVKNEEGRMVTKLKIT